MSDTSPSGLTAALAAFQAELPKVTKGNQADVPGKEGKRGYSYKYADLAEVSAAVLPKLAAHGLAWTCLPELSDHGMVLRGQLLHVSGESKEGVWPLPGNATPQVLGGAMTYGRRYLLSSLTGVAADEDDDGAHATEAMREHYQRPQQAQSRQRPAVDPDVADLTNKIRDLIGARGWEPQAVADRFREEHGVPAERGTADQLRSFLALLNEDAAMEDDTTAPRETTAPGDDAPGHPVTASG